MKITITYSGGIYRARFEGRNGFVFGDTVKEALDRLKYWVATGTRTQKTVLAQKYS
jgi:hypothetical protein